MKLKKYLLDIMPQIIVSISGLLIVILLLNVFDTDKNIKIGVAVNLSIKSRQ